MEILKTKEYVYPEKLGKGTDSGYVTNVGRFTGKEHTGKILWKA